jgi:hypothetical protein
MVYQDAQTTTSTGWLVALLVLYLVALVALMVLLMLDLKYIRDSRHLAKELNLPRGQWLRPVKTLAFDPIIELVAVGVILAKDLVENWEHLVVGIAGVIVGLTVGHYRYRIQYVRALPQHKAIVFVRSRAEYIALGILLVVSFASEQEEIAVVGPLTLLITFLLAVVVSESIGRAWFSFRRYRRDLAGDTSPAGT